MSTDQDALARPTRIADDDSTVIVAQSADHPDAVRLLHAFYDDQVSRYGFAESVDLNPTEYAPPSGAFAIVYHHGRPVGCGCFRWFPARPDTVEIKKTYLEPDLRGRGAGRALLAWLEQHAARAGAKQVILETGIRNTAALRLFTADGFRPIPSYVPGRPTEINRAFIKTLPPMVPSLNDEATAG